MEKGVTRRDFLRISAGLAATALVAACAPAPPAAEEEMPEEEAPEAEASTRDTLRVWIAWPEDYAFNHYMKENIFPQLTEKNGYQGEVSYINWREIARRYVETAAAGQAPDLTDCSETLGTMAFLGFLYDLKEKANEWGVYDDLYPGALDVCEMDGKLWQFPIYYGTRCNYINKEIFDEVGLDPDNPPETWEDFQEACIKLTTGDEESGFERVGYDRCIASHGAYETFSGRWLAQNGIRDFDQSDRFLGKCQINTEKGAETMKWFCDLVRVHHIFPLRGGSPWPDGVYNAVVEGYLGYGETGPWWIPNIREARPDILERDILKILLPMKRVERAGNMDCQGIGVNAHSDLLDVAIDFMELYVDHDNHIGLLMSPDPGGDPLGKCWMTTGFRSVNEDPNFWIMQEPLVSETPFLEALDYGVQPARDHVGYIEFAEDVMVRALEQMLFQTKPDQDVLDDAAAKADAITERTVREWG